MVDYERPIKCARCDKNEATDLVEAGDTILCVCPSCLREADHVLKLVKSIPGGGIEIE